MDLVCWNPCSISIRWPALFTIINVVLGFLYIREFVTSKSEVFYLAYNAQTMFFFPSNVILSVATLYIGSNYWKLEDWWSFEQFKLWLKAYWINQIIESGHSKLSIWTLGRRRRRSCDIHLSSIQHKNWTLYVFVVNSSHITMAKLVQDLWNSLRQKIHQNIIAYYVGAYVGWWEVLLYTIILSYNVKSALLLRWTVFHTFPWTNDNQPKATHHPNNDPSLSTIVLKNKIMKVHAKSWSHDNEYPSSYITLTWKQQTTYVEHTSPAILIWRVHIFNTFRDEVFIFTFKQALWSAFIHV